MTFPLCFCFDNENKFIGSTSLLLYLSISVGDNNYSHEMYIPKFKLFKKYPIVRWTLLILPLLLLMPLVVADIQVNDWEYFKERGRKHLKNSETCA